MRKKKPTAADRAVAKAVDNAVARALSGHPIKIMDISKVYDRAWYLAGNGMTADQLEASLTSYVRSIEVKTQVAS